MADMKITEYNSHNAPATGDQFFMIGTSEEYRIDYDALASAILDKLTTKTYSGISNNVIDAIAALNSSLRKYVVTTGEKTYEVMPIGLIYITHSSNSARIFQYSNSMITNLAGSSDSDVVVSSVDATHIKITNNHTWNLRMIVIGMS
jgi:hypothetical protein